MDMLCRLRGHKWEWVYSEKDPFLRRRVCNRCGAKGRVNDSGRHKWYSISTSKEQLQKYLRLHSAIQELGDSQMVWWVRSEKKAWGRKATLETVMERSSVVTSESKLKFTNVPVSIIKGEFGSLSFYPEEIDFSTDTIDKRVAKSFSVKYKKWDVALNIITFVENKYPRPTDAQIVDYTWLYARVDGGPDRRYSANRRIPILKYASVTLSCAQGHWRFLVSSIPHARSMVATLHEYINHVPASY